MAKNDINVEAPAGRRMLDGDELGYLLLLLMEGEVPRHGYDLIKEIKTRSGGNYAPSSGIVYPKLSTMMDQMLLSSSAPSDQKRAYVLNADGKHYLDEHRTEAQGVLARIEALRFRGTDVSAGPVGRAMQGLKTALGQKLAGDPTRDLQLDVADIIDEAVRKIERL
ncbi:PadR family transcriptional regulator [Rhizobium leguminosarum]|uniref:PadR family transcriptional regulator n=2 Tax=Rhizobium leguminosarum TaxID=384 RepID=A0ACD5FIA0_RHILE|nr:helix-turn-helix transcriptional regulator [Rhizobium leguminosarum]